MACTLPVLTLAFCLGLLAGCDALTGDDEGTTVLTGRVLDAALGLPVAGAYVQVLPAGAVAETDSAGWYEVRFGQRRAGNVQLTADKNGYRRGAVNVFAVPGRSVEVAPVELARASGAGSAASGPAASIVLGGQSHQALAVRGTGGPEAATFVFVVTDSLGRPLAADQSTTVHFDFGLQTGGALLAPDSARTDHRGEARVVVSSGTATGLLQVIATVETGGAPLRLETAAVPVHGGPPDLQHFSVRPAIYNLPLAWHTYGMEVGVTAFVGDVYGNPVRPGTPVSFISTGGIIQGSATTDVLGRASVRLISAAPKPEHPQFGTGYTEIEVHTAGAGGEDLEAATLVLFSAYPQVYFPPSQGTLLIGRTYQFFVYDENQNPLAAGTTITVRADGVNVEAIGNTDIVLEDVWFGGTGVTEFTFSLRTAGEQDAEGQPLDPDVQRVTIDVEGPNGKTRGVYLQDGTRLRAEPDDPVLRPIP